MYNSRLTSTFVAVLGLLAAGSAVSQSADSSKLDQVVVAGK